MNASNADESYLTVVELAKAMGISRTTLYKAIDAGAIVGYRLAGNSQRRYLLSEALQAFRPVTDLSAEVQRRCEAAAKRARAAHDRKVKAGFIAPAVKGRTA